MFRQHSHTSSATVGCFLVFLGLVGPTAFEALHVKGTRLSEGILSTTTGADPSNPLALRGVNCGWTNAAADNGTDPPPNPLNVDSNVCNGQVPVDPPTDPPTYQYKNPNSPCIRCPVILQSITVGSTVVTNGYFKVGAQPCQVAPERGRKGTCDNTGNCANLVFYDCNTALNVYQQQSGPGG